MNIHNNRQDYLERATQSENKMLNNFRDKHLSFLKRLLEALEYSIKNILVAEQK